MREQVHETRGNSKNQQKNIYMYFIMFIKLVSGPVRISYKTFVQTPLFKQSEKLVIVPSLDGIHSG